MRYWRNYPIRSAISFMFVPACVYKGWCHYGNVSHLIWPWHISHVQYASKRWKEQCRESFCTNHSVKVNECFLSMEFVLRQCLLLQIKCMMIQVSIYCCHNTLSIHSYELCTCFNGVKSKFLINRIHHPSMGYHKGKCLKRIV